MNTIKKILSACFFVLCLATGSNVTVAAVIQTGMEQPINNTLKHLEEALAAANANDLEAAQEHMKAARQASKHIIGGTLEAKAQRGADSIVSASVQAKEGNTEGTAAALKAAIAVYKSMLRPFEAGSQGGLK